MRAYSIEGERTSGEYVIVLPISSPDWKKEAMPYTQAELPRCCGWRGESVGSDQLVCDGRTSRSSVAR